MTAFSPLYDCAAARVLEQQASAYLKDGVFTLMQRAGQSAWQILHARWSQIKRVTVICGPGNNGGDGYVLALNALRAQYDVVVLSLKEHAPRTSLAQRACSDYVAAGGRIMLFAGALPQADLLVDALFGIGLTREPTGQAKQLIEAVNAQSVPVLSLDVPSGVDASQASVQGVAIRADTTLQFIVNHHGLRTGEGLEHAGELMLNTLDVPTSLLQTAPVRAQLLMPEHLPHWLKPRRLNTHKGENGHVLCIGGELGHGGAIMMAAEAALRSGAGLVSVATRKAHIAPLLVRRPEMMAYAVKSSEELKPLIAAADVIAIGPGLGQAVWGKNLLHAILETGKPLVLDADALNLIAALPQPLPQAVITPHPGEAARLLRITTAEVQSDRFEAVAKLAEQFQTTVVLKGAGTLIAQHGQLPRVIAAGNPGMATGGMGDVLTGVIAAMLGQKLELFEAASAGALLHSMAADVAANTLGERGLLASDLFEALPRLASQRHFSNAAFFKNP